MSDGAGYSAISMLPATRTYIVKNDTDFARQIVAHNRTCAKDKLCAK